MPCPKCGSKKIKRSHSRGLKERLQKLFNQRPYRCTDCGWRGIIKTKSSHKKRDGNKYILIQIITIIIIIIAVYFIISYLSREEATADQQSAIIYTKTFIT
jgi:DNA-directed RNA polymerase subunit RPC12/RpoP